MESLVYCVMQLVKQHASLPNLIYPNKYSMLLSANTLQLSCIELGTAAFIYIYGMIINVQLLTFFLGNSRGGPYLNFFIKLSCTYAAVKFQLKILEAAIKKVDYKLHEKMLVGQWH
jgi:hypothetical protein